MGRGLHPLGGSPQTVRRLRLWPQSLVGQIIILVAIALFVAQAINFGLLLRERNRVDLTAQTAPVVYRVINALDMRADRRPDRLDRPLNPDRREEDRERPERRLSLIHISEPTRH